MMENLAVILKNNGARFVPREVLGHWFMAKKWAKSCELLKKFTKELKSQKDFWEWHTNVLLENWGNIEIPKFEQLVQLKELDFTNPKDAEKILQSNLQILQIVKLNDVVWDINVAQRTKWLQELLDNVPEGKDFVTIKSRYRPFCEENERKFDQEAEEKVGGILYCVGVPTWVAISVEDAKSVPIEKLAESWSMTAKRSTVVYS